MDYLILMFFIVNWCGIYKKIIYYLIKYYGIFVFSLVFI